MAIITKFNQIMISSLKCLDLNPRMSSKPLCIFLKSKINLNLRIHPLCIVDSYSPLSILVEISSHSRTEKKQSGKIWYGWCNHIFPDLHCLVSPSLHVTGQISGWSN